MEKMSPPGRLIINCSSFASGSQNFSYRRARNEIKRAVFSAISLIWMYLWRLRTPEDFCRIAFYKMSVTSSTRVQTGCVACTPFGPQLIIGDCQFLNAAIFLYKRKCFNNFIGKTVVLFQFP